MRSTRALTNTCQADGRCSFLINPGQRGVERSSAPYQKRISMGAMGSRASIARSSQSASWRRGTHAPGQLNDETRAAPAGQGTDVSVGHYRLLQRLGEGRFGTVYLAEQSEPVRRHVAIKILKPGVDSRQIVARFEQERQALALMEHPNYCARAR